MKREGFGTLLHIQFSHTVIDIAISLWSERILLNILSASRPLSAIRAFLSFFLPALSYSLFWLHDSPAKILTSTSAFRCANIARPVTLPKNEAAIVKTCTTLMGKTNNVPRPYVNWLRMP